MRLIDADKLVAHLKDEIEGCKPLYCGRTNGKSIAYGTVLGLKSAIAFMEALATVEAEPVVHVEWIYDEYGNPHCSRCDHIQDVPTNYCSECGANMKGAKT